MNRVVKATQGFICYKSQTMPIFLKKGLGTKLYKNVTYVCHFFAFLERSRLESLVT